MEDFLNLLNLFDYFLIHPKEFLLFLLCYNKTVDEKKVDVL
jgi:hypothetical protein